MDFIMVVLQALQILALPVIIVIWFTYSLRSFLRTPKDNRQERKSILIQLIISGALTLFIVFIVVWLIVLFSSPISFM